MWEKEKYWQAQLFMLSHGSEEVIVNNIFYFIYHVPLFDMIDLPIFDNKINHWDNCVWRYLVSITF